MMIPLICISTSSPNSSTVRKWDSMYGVVIVSVIFSEVVSKLI